ncbi:hypothetical protein [Notoacmeibacter sp. MSK16QG-6]|uniref:hypothetical protein n=1 Tax=Notoacmeibacter sp. MSK16QG-6 TaxID=2957982 RepID=UPI00209FEF75|nr:hypothetical protein [Notoacmeibacter sp. MSK16QG-6]MCP1200054.1 hypothetical protein [Notoacmeibacter sp. MSK16QG-6]
MKKVVIREGFTGYPTDKGGATHFKAGETVSVSDEFAELIIGKGHAKAAETKKDKDA